MTRLQNARLAIITATFRHISSLRRPLWTGGEAFWDPRYRRQCQSSQSQHFLCHDKCAESFSGASILVANMGCSSSQFSPELEELVWTCPRVNGCMRFKLVFILTETAVRPRFFGTSILHTRKLGLECRLFRSFSILARPCVHECMLFASSREEFSPLDSHQSWRTVFEQRRKVLKG